MSTPTLEVPAAAAAPAPADAGAPYGRFANGKARKGPAAPKKRSARTSSPRPASGQRKAVDYRPGIVGITQAVSIPLAFVSPLDALVVQTYSEPMAQALNDVAQQRPEVAAVLDRVLQVGPWGELAAILLSAGVQIAHNHDLVPESLAVKMGATPKRVLMEHLQVKGRQMAESAGEAAAAGVAYTTQHAAAA